MKYVLFFYMVILSGVTLSQCVEGDCFNGWGKFKCDCGYVFEGEFVDGKRISGTLTKSDLQYVGEFQNELAHGYGKITYQDGSWYEGTFEENVPVGFGTYYLSATQKYIGEIVNGEFKGLGAMYFTQLNGDFNQLEIGQYQKDVLNGFGYVRGLDHAFYFGFYEEGEKRGFGIRYMPGNKTLEVGEFKKNGSGKSNIIHTQTNESLIVIEDFKVKNSLFKVTGSFDGNYLKIEKIASGVLEFVAIYEEENELLYISNSDNPLVGTVIKMDGKQFDSTMDNTMDWKVQIGQERFKMEL